MITHVLWGLPVSLCLWAGQSSQEPLLPKSPSSSPQKALSKSSSQKGLPEVHGDCEQAESFGGSELERGAFCQLRSRRYASVRTLARKALEVDPLGYRALFLLGAAQHRGEGNLPKALRQLQQAERSFTQAYGHRISEEDIIARTVGYRILFELMDVHGEMDHHEQRIFYADAITSRLGIDHEASKAWPLMKLGRFAEARTIVETALTSDDAWNRSVARTSLCAIESEQRRREEAYEACREAAEMGRKRRHGGAVELTNAGAAAEEVFRFAEAERLFLEAARRAPETSVNPWGRLVHLYLAQGRFSEALKAWREMRTYRAARPYAYLNQQDEAEAQLVGAAIMLVAGRSDLAEPVTRHIIDRPDRQGTSSAASEQNEAGAALVARVARLGAARRLEYQASIASWWDALGLRAQAARLRFDAWLVGRQAALTLAKPERLVTTLRPEVPGSLELPSWLDAEVIQLVGPGVSEVALQQARQEETLDAELVDPIFWAYEAEIAWLKGDYVRAYARGRASVDEASRGLTLVAARAAMWAGHAAAQLGRYDEARRAFREALDRDPGIFARVGVPIPVRFESVQGSDLATSTIAYLRWSPMFQEASWGFRLVVGDERAQLLGVDGSELSEVQLERSSEERDQNPDAARKLADEIHQQIASPVLDITQVDISSLEGFVGRGKRASEELRKMSGQKP